MNLNEFWNSKINSLYNILHCILKIQPERGTSRYATEEIDYLFKKARAKENSLERRDGNTEEMEAVMEEAKKQVCKGEN